MAKYCKSCGSQLLEGVKFCKSCGASVDAVVPVRPVAPPEQPLMQQQQPSLMQQPSSPPQPQPQPPPPPPPMLQRPQQPPQVQQQPRVQQPPQQSQRPSQPPVYTPPAYSDYTGATTQAAKTKGKNNLLKVLVPVGIVVIAAVVVTVLWAAGLFSQSDSNNRYVSGNSPTTGTSDSGSADTGVTGSDDPRQTALPPTTKPTDSIGDPTSSSPGSTDMPDLPFGGELPVFGSIQVNNATSYAFTPDRTGLWVFYTASTGSDPMLTIYEEAGIFIMRDDDGLGDAFYNSELVVYLTVGTSYIVQASFYGGASGRCTLTVKAPIAVPDAGIEMSVNASQGYIFTPSQSGSWEFRTSNNGAYDPFLIVYAPDGSQLGNDDDGAGNKNALLTLDLQAGETYDIYAGFYESGPAYYDLSIVRR